MGCATGQERGKGQEKSRWVTGYKNGGESSPLSLWKKKNSESWEALPKEGRIMSYGSQKCEDM